MLKINKLKGKIVENGKTISDVAEAVGIDRATMYRRLAENGETFTVREVSAIAKCLHLTVDDVNDIFFGDFVA